MRSIDRSTSFTYDHAIRNPRDFAWETWTHLQQKKKKRFRQFDCTISELASSREARRMKSRELRNHG